MTQDPKALPDCSTYPVTLFTEFEVALTISNVPINEAIPTPPINYVIHTFFIVVAAILLTNLIIAMMNNTHSRVAQERDVLWRTQVINVKKRVIPKTSKPRSHINLQIKSQNSEVRRWSEMPESKKEK